MGIWGYCRPFTRSKQVEEYHDFLHYAGSPHNCDEWDKWRRMLAVAEATNTLPMEKTEIFLPEGIQN